MIVYLLFELSKARQAKTEHMKWKSRTYFCVLVVLTKNELTKICNEPGNNVLCISKIEDIKWKKKLQKYFHRPNCVSCGVQFWGPARKRREKSRCCLSQWFQMTKNSPKIRLQNS